MGVASQKWAWPWLTLGFLPPLLQILVTPLKLGIKRITEGSLQDRLSKFLFTYRITPHSTTEVAPAELLMGQRLRSRLDLLYPDLQTRVETQQLKQKQQHDSTKPLRSFLPGDTVFAQNFRGAQMVASDSCGRHRTLVLSGGATGWIHSVQAY